ncbi:MAG: methyl-accepting chemotaxis protein, partial [Gammaproteobacteria bacterium]
MSIKQAMTRFGAVLGVALLLLGIVSVVELQAVKRVEKETEVALEAVRAVTLMDMHHEGIEGTVYHYLVALLEGDVQEQGSVRDALTQTIDDMQGLYQQLMDLPLSEQERQALRSLEGNLNHYYQTARRQVQAENQVAYQQGVDAFKEAFDTLETSLDQAGEAIEQAAKAQLEESAGSIALAEWVIILGILGVIGLAAWNLWKLWQFLSAQLGGEVAEVAGIARQITEGKLDMALDESRPGLYADLRTMQQKLRIQFEEVSRLRQALETVTTNVMVADEHFNIVYMNPAVTKMMQVAEEDIRTVFPDFRADDLLGKSIDLFHKNPAHQRAMLEKLQGTHKAQITLGGRHFDLTAAPVIGPGGERLGSVVEWADITDQLKVEKEIQALVDDASQGKLDTRLALEGKEGFALNLSTGLNTILDRMQAVFNDVQRTAEALAQGNLTVSIDAEYAGQYGAIANALNNAVDKLHHAMASIVTSTQNIRQSMQEIASGNAQLSERTEKQSSNLEETASSMEELASNVRNTAANAREANELAQTTRQKAELGGEVVQRTIASMEEINVASNKIAEIIDVIDD